jgi:hypothetical protein
MLWRLYGFTKTHLWGIMIVSSALGLGGMAVAAYSFTTPPSERIRLVQPRPHETFPSISWPASPFGSLAAATKQPELLPHKNVWSANNISHVIHR